MSIFAAVASLHWLPITSRLQLCFSQTGLLPGRIYTQRLGFSRPCESIADGVSSTGSKPPLVWRAPNNPLKTVRTSALYQLRNRSVATATGRSRDDRNSQKRLRAKLKRSAKHVIGRNGESWYLHAEETSSWTSYETAEIIKLRWPTAFLGTEQIRSL